MRTPIERLQEVVVVAAWCLSWITQRRKLALRFLAGGITLLFLANSTANGADTPDYWAQQKKDGNWRNSSDKSLQGNLRLRWAQALRNFSSETPTYGGLMAQRSGNVSIRDGKILLVIPGTSYPYATYGIYALANGTLVCSATGIQPRGADMGDLGAVDINDVPYGTINQYWQADGTIYTGYGGDWGNGRHFNPYNGEAIGNGRWQGPVGPDTWGFFGMSNSNPQLFATGSTANGSYLYGLQDATNGNAIVTGGEAEAYYGQFGEGTPFITDGNVVYFINYSPISITAHSFQASPPAETTLWTYSNSAEWEYNGFGWGYSQAPGVAHCLATDGRLYYLGYNSTGDLLRGVRTADGVGDVAIALPSGSGYGVINMAARGPYVVVYNGNNLNCIQHDEPNSCME